MVFRSKFSGPKVFKFWAILTRLNLEKKVRFRRDDTVQIVNEKKIVKFHVLFILWAICLSLSQFGKQLSGFENLSSLNLYFTSKKKILQKRLSQTRDELRP